MIGITAETPARCVRRITEILPGPLALCRFAEGNGILVPRCVTGYLQRDDEIEFSSGLIDNAVPEFRVIRSHKLGPRELYFAPIGSVSQPATDKRNQVFLRADVVDSALSLRSVYLPIDCVRDYFYRGDRGFEWAESPTLYEVLRVGPSASPGELRLAYKMRRLELQADPDGQPELRDVERAFNILMQPSLRACYDELLRDPEAPALFPNSGFGSLLVSGELSRDRETFFATRISVFAPALRRRRFQVALRQLEFLSNHAVVHDSRRRLDMLLDPAILPLSWDPTWNQWKQWLNAKIGVAATFLASGKYRRRGGEWRLIAWSSALPSSLEITVPADIQRHIDTAWRVHQLLGRWSSMIEGIRSRLQNEPLEAAQIVALLGELGLPSGFDISQISWMPGYDRSFYEQLSKRARKVYLYRQEYIFDLPGGVAVEVPAVGHATYLFGKCCPIDEFVRLYAGTSRDDIRKNRNGVAERLGFVGRITHGSSRRTWLKQLEMRVGNSFDAPSQ